MKQRERDHNLCQRKVPKFVCRSEGKHNKSDALGDLVKIQNGNLLNTSYNGHILNEHQSQHWVCGNNEHDS